MSDFTAEMHHIRFRLGLRHRPRSGISQRPTSPLAGEEGAGCPLPKNPTSILGPSSRQHYLYTVNMRQGYLNRPVTYLDNWPRNQLAFSELADWVICRLVKSPTPNFYKSLYSDYIIPIFCKTFS